MAVIELATLFDFGCHVCEGASVGLKELGADSRITEISDLECHARSVDEDIFQLDVSMRHLSLVHVLHGLKELTEEEAASSLTEA